jgi:hypothetical protein
MGRNMVRTGTRWHALIGQFAFTRLGMSNSAGGFSAESECGWIAAARQAALLRDRTRQVATQKSELNDSSLYSD